ncbi:hypothetical protein SNEBB_004762 [Seison nebaliae]|nr:hypothetical protein SNEBB_004762 [Seison nebaliae]
MSWYYYFMMTFVITNVISTDSTQLIRKEGALGLPTNWQSLIYLPIAESYLKDKPEFLRFVRYLRKNDIKVKTESQLMKEFQLYKEEILKESVANQGLGQYREYFFNILQKMYQTSVENNDPNYYSKEDSYVYYESGIPYTNVEKCLFGEDKFNISCDRPDFTFNRFEDVVLKYKTINGAGDPSPNGASCFYKDVACTRPILYELTPDKQKKLFPNMLEVSLNYLNYYYQCNGTYLYPTHVLFRYSCHKIGNPPNSTFFFTVEPPPKDPSKLDWWKILLIVLACVAFLIIVGVLIFFLLRKSKKPKNDRAYSNKRTDREFSKEDRDQYDVQYHHNGNFTSPAYSPPSPEVIPKTETHNLKSRFIPVYHVNSKKDYQRTSSDELTDDFNGSRISYLTPRESLQEMEDKKRRPHDGGRNEQEILYVNEKKPKKKNHHNHHQNKHHNHQRYTLDHNY